MFDKLPIVLMLRVGALLIFAASLLHIINLFLLQGAGINTLELIAMVVTSSLFSPLVLLALAEIIVLMGKKNDQN